jgi:2-polyprenyl-6-hydroxyphenyl methylase/3-demethylubiquinone-9 3-methyltransferase
MPGAGPESLKFDEKTHFAFGKNWHAYRQTITESDIENATAQLRRLMGRETLVGVRFLDIGCGSGIHSLAALRLGADFVHGVDIDPDSVATTADLLSEQWNCGNYKVEKQNIFELQPTDIGMFDVVYSWGVLHHTGDMWTAITNAANFVETDGLFAIALYRKTRLCGFWTWEKRRYTQGGPIFRGAAIGTFVTAKVGRDLVRFKNPLRWMRPREKKRGMKWYRDAIDWVGGFPYESAAPEEVVDHVSKMGFKSTGLFRDRKSLGLFGSGNTEYVFRKIN